ncbi:hypothetical protein SEA_BUDSKI_82 [Gordonia phage Budski]|nr:hypothetical protein SEA_BUDSKI_82 [Gordonia phage Budski]
MPSDTPTPAEIAAEHRYREQDHGTIEGVAYCWCGWSTKIVNTHKTAITLWSEHVIAALSEHYHLLPKSEVVVEYTVAWTADNGNVIPFGRTNQTVWRPGADRELAELQADIQKDGGDDADRYYVAQRLQSRWSAADVAEEPK